MITLLTQQIHTYKDTVHLRHDLPICKILGTGRALYTKIPGFSMSMYKNKLTFVDFIDFLSIFITFIDAVLIRDLNVFYSLGVSQHAKQVLKGLG